MHFKLFIKFSLLLVSSVTVMCQEFNKNILIMVSEGSVNDSAYNSIAAIVQKYKVR